MLERLTEREREVLTLRYSLSEDQNEPKTLEQVGEALQLSREQARQIEAGALQKLRRSSEPTAPPPDVNAEILSELRAIRGELAGLREENAALRSLLQP